MKTLFLLRHCEANQFDEKTTDHNKELNEKGKNEAILLKSGLRIIILILILFYHQQLGEL